MIRAVIFFALFQRVQDFCAFVNYPINGYDGFESQSLFVDLLEVRETKKYLFILVFAAVAGFVAVWHFVQLPQAQVAGVFADSPTQLPVAPDLPVLRSPKLAVATPPPLDLSARAALVEDRGSHTVLYEKNAQAVVPIASLTKLMTAVVASELTSPDEVVSILPADIETPEYRTGLVAGERIRVGDLLKAMLVSSANDAALALARYSGGTVEQFVAEMNDEAKTLGMNHTQFSNPVGFDDAGHFSTADDLSKLVEKFLANQALTEIVKTKQVTVASVDGQYRHDLETTNKLMLKYSDVVGLKTGYTAEAKGNLIILVDLTQSGDPGQIQYYSIVLGSNNREAETEKVMQWVQENFQWG